MDDGTCGPRLTTLRHDIEQLKARRDEIADALDDQPTAPPAATIDAIRGYLGHLIAESTSAERKAAIEASPQKSASPTPDLTPTAESPATGTTDDTVRAMLQSVPGAGVQPLPHTDNRLGRSLTVSAVLAIPQRKRA